MGRQIIINWNGAALGGVTIQAPNTGLSTVYPTYTSVRVSCRDQLTIQWGTGGQHGVNEIAQLNCALPGTIIAAPSSTGSVTIAAGGYTGLRRYFKDPVGTNCVAGIALEVVIDSC